MEGDDAEAIQQKLQALMQSAMKLGEAMYKAGAGATGATGATAEAAAPQPDAAASDGDGKVVDAEFEDLGEKK